MWRLSVTAPADIDDLSNDRRGWRYSIERDGETRDIDILLSSTLYASDISAEIRAVKGREHVEHVLDNDDPPPRLIANTAAVLPESAIEERD